MAYSIIVLGFISLLSAGVNYWQYHQQQDTTKQLAVVSKTSNDRLEVIGLLQNNIQQQAVHVQALNHTQVDLSNRLADREQLLRDLKNEYKDYQAWSNVKLPVITQRLRKRPAINGAAAYQQYLSNHQPLQPATKQPHH